MFLSFRENATLASTTGTDLCRRPVVGRVVEGCADGRLMGQTGILALDGVRVLVGVAAVVVAPSVAGTEGAGFTQRGNPQRKESRCCQRGRYPCSSLCV